MKLATKVLILFVCVSLCAVGVILSGEQAAPTDRAKTNVVPVNNHRKQSAIWVWS
jgi:cell division protein FtsL